MLNIDKQISHKGLTCYFNDKEHKYWSTNLPVGSYTSGSAINHYHFKPFDAHGASLGTARKLGISQGEVLEMWDNKRDTACVFGTKIHLYCENLILGKILPTPSSDKEVAYMKLADETIQRMDKVYEWVEVEQFFFSEELQLCGQADIILRHKNTSRLFISDWKTNGKDLTSGQYSKWGLGQLNHIPDHNLGHYTLQLNLYRYLALFEGFYQEDIEMFIVHFLDDKVYTPRIPILNDETDYIVKQQIKRIEKEKTKL